MRDRNSNALTGKVTNVRYCTIKDRFAFLNIEVDNIPVVISLGGDKYTEAIARQLEATLRSNCHIMIADANMDMSKSQKSPQRELTTRDGMFFTTFNDLNKTSFSTIVGQVKEITQENNVVWAIIGASYYSRKPNQEKGEYKDRFIKVRLDKAWGQDVVGKRMSIQGNLVFDNELFVNASESVVM